MDFKLLGFGFITQKMVYIAQLAAAISGGIFLILQKKKKLHRQVSKDIEPQTRGIYKILGGLGIVLWISLTLLNYKPYINLWDLYHYYLGGKYFKETGYDKLYSCAVIADYENGNKDEMKRRKYRDLGNYKIKKTSELVHDRKKIDYYKSAFSNKRWKAFKADVEYFRNVSYRYIMPRMNLIIWPGVHLDHGFNPPPTWLILGGTIANLGPASNMQIMLIVLIDIFLLILMWIVVYRTFGLEICCIALLILGTNQLGEFGWTTMSYLRYGWLFCCVIGICLMKIDRYAAAGAFIAYSAMLRIFPIFIGFVFFRVGNFADDYPTQFFLFFLFQAFSGRRNCRFRHCFYYCNCCFRERSWRVE